MFNKVKCVFSSAKIYNVRWIVPRCTRNVQVSASSSPEYLYTHNQNNILTPEQQQFYDDNGYLLVRKLVKEEHMAKYRDRFKSLLKGELRVPGMKLMKDVAHVKSTETTERVITRAYHLHNDEALYQYSLLPEITDYATSFIGPNLRTIHTLYINKPPDAGTKSSRHPMHQDLFFIPLRPSHKIVAAWTALERSHRGNGCLVCLPGTHTGVMFTHGYPQWGDNINKMFLGVNYIPNIERQWLEMEPGDTVFFHPLLVHGSGVNNSEGSRQAIVTHFAASGCKYIDVRGSTQEDHAAEYVVAQKIEKTESFTEDFRDFWKKRSRHICGK